VGDARVRARAQVDPQHRISINPRWSFGCGSRRHHRGCRRVGRVDFAGGRTGAGRLVSGVRFGSYAGVATGLAVPAALRAVGGLLDDS